MRAHAAGAVLLALVAVQVAACGASRPRPETAEDGPRRTGPGGTRPMVQEGRASWYGNKFHGRKTASGERFNQNAFTAAHRKLPFGTRVQVTNMKNGRKVQVRINDRGPFGGRAIIDLSRAAARQLDMIQDGIVPVRVEVLWIP